MAQIRNFRTEYTNLLPNDYFEISNMGRTTNDKITFTNIAKTITNNKVLSNKCTLTKDSNEDLIATPLSTFSNVKLFDGLSYYFVLNSIPYLWQYKNYPMIKVGDLDYLHIYSGWVYNATPYGYKYMDTNTISNGIGKIVWSVDAQGWLYYNMSSQISKDFHNPVATIDGTYRAGSEIIDGRAIDENFYPYLKLRFGSELPNMSNVALAGSYSNITVNRKVKDGQIDNIKGSFNIIGNLLYPTLVLFVDGAFSRSVGDKKDLGTEFTTIQSTSKGLTIDSSTQVNAGNNTLTKRYGVYYRYYQ